MFQSILGFSIYLEKDEGSFKVDLIDASFSVSFSESLNDEVASEEQSFHGPNRRRETRKKTKVLDVTDIIEVALNITSFES